MSDIWVQSITHLKGKPRADAALEMLKKIASLVKPIMRRHKWVLPILAEFFPENPGLLGLSRSSQVSDASSTDYNTDINMGQKILVRLRYAGSPDAFLPLEEVVGTMLHELTHNVHGPHDELFYKFLAGLQDEYDALRRSGYGGEGFYSKGRRLGKDVSHNVPQYIGRIKALEAAEMRRRNSRILVAGGSRLGGGSKNSGLTPREMAVKAAEQRARDEKSCASGALAQREAEKAAKESVESKVIDLTLDDDVDDYIYSDFDQDIIIIDDDGGTSRNGGNSSSSTPKGWTCMACTFINLPTTSHCDMCELPRPKTKLPEQKVAPPARNLNSTSGRLPPSVITHPDWSCSKCTLDNPHEFWRCAACGAIKAQG